MTANLPVLSFLLTKTVKKLSWANLSDEGSPDRKWYAHAKYDKDFNPELERHSRAKGDKGFGFRDTRSLEGQPTVRHDVEYGTDESEEVHDGGVGKDNE